MELYGISHGLALPMCMGLNEISAWVCIGHLHGLAWAFAWASFGHLHGLALSSPWACISLLGVFVGAHWAALGNSRVGFFRSSGASLLLMAML